MNYSIPQQLKLEIDNNVLRYLNSLCKKNQSKLTVVEKRDKKEIESVYSKEDIIDESFPKDTGVHKIIITQMESSRTFIPGQEEIFNYIFELGTDYFLDNESRVKDYYLLSAFGEKSGQIAESFFRMILYKFCNYDKSYIRYQYVDEFTYTEPPVATITAKFDVATPNTIVEIKNYLFDSTGTADEKIEGDIKKYEPFITWQKYKNMIVVISAKFEELFMSKHFPILCHENDIKKYFDEGIYITFMSSIINDFSQNENMSFLKWVGGKSKLLNNINKRIDKYIEKHPNGSMYYEPFLGSGSVLINVLTNYSDAFDTYWCSDVNAELINTFKEIQHNHEKLIKLLESIQTYYLNLDASDKETAYYQFRDTYNIIRNTKECDINYILNICPKDVQSDISTSTTLLISALFIFLNKTCFRGIYRVNSKGEFNVPYGNYKSPTIVNSEYLNQLHELFTKNDVEFIACSYDDEQIIPTYENALLYIDPPYFNTFDSYSIYGFDYNQFDEYLTKIEQIPFILSNSYDFKDHVNGLYVEELSINDRINSKQPANKRIEILVTNFE